MKYGKGIAEVMAAAGVLKAARDAAGIAGHIEIDDHTVVRVTLDKEGIDVVLRQPELDNNIRLQEPGIIILRDILNKCLPPVIPNDSAFARRLLQRILDHSAGGSCRDGVEEMLRLLPNLPKDFDAKDTVPVANVVAFLDQIIGHVDLGASGEVEMSEFFIGFTQLLTEHRDDLTGGAVQETPEKERDDAEA